MLRLGSITCLVGNVTTLNWVDARPAHLIEQNLGFRPGRLSRGYWVMLLKEQLQADEFEFDGTTMRSGGRAGLPAPNEIADQLRPGIHAGLLAERGVKGYVELKKRILPAAAISGAMRIVKIIPDERLLGPINPSHKFPMGGGGLQWKLIKDKPFLAALHVDGNGLASAPGFSADLSVGAKYEDRARVRQWLVSA